MNRLQYIVNSPPEAMGGFHPETCETARLALAELASASKGAQTNDRVNQLLAERVNLMQAELDTLKSFVRSLNSYSFEKWIGCYHEGQFCIFDGEGEVVAAGKDAFDAWEEFVKNENK